MSDLISKDKLIEALYEDYGSIYSHIFCHVPFTQVDELFIDLRVFLENQPIVDAVAVVHGEWVKGFLGEWNCSICGEENCYAYSETLKRFTDLYCPNCGAKMDGKKVE